MSDQDLLQLYSARILALAADVPRTERLAAPDGTARARSPLCGSTVTVDVALEDGRIAGFGQEVRACALGQAAAAVVGSAALGLRGDEVRRARDALWAMLRDGGAAPDAPFEGLAVLQAARAHPNRHASIMLAFDATLAAIAEAEKKAATTP